MNHKRIIWFLLALLVSLVGAWAVNQDVRVSKAEERLGWIERKWEQIDTKLELLLDRAKGCVSGAE